MVYRRYHENCEEIECNPLSAYVRIDGKWKKIGYYGSECKKFELLDLEKERAEKEQDTINKENLARSRAEMRKLKEESREKLKIMDNELKVNKSFFKN